MSKVVEIIDDLKNIDGLTSPAQEELISGTNIKTVNGESVLGGGNITVNTGGLKSVQAFTSSGTWTKPTGINFIKVIAIGGGGGGCSGGNGAYGGAAGATIIRYIDATSINTASIVIGAGGARGGGGATAGGNTIISGGISLTANGASGSSSEQRRPAGGIPSVETLPNLSMPGGAGGATADIALNESGCGGDSFLSPGGVGACSDTGRSATSGKYGSGGGGGYNGTYIGGNGGSGVVIIEEYIR